MAKSKSTKELIREELKRQGRETYAEKVKKNPALGVTTSMLREKQAELEEKKQIDSAMAAKVAEINAEKAADIADARKRVFEQNRPAWARTKPAPFVDTEVEARLREIQREKDREVEQKREEAIEFLEQDTEQETEQRPFRLQDIGSAEDKKRISDAIKMRETGIDPNSLEGRLDSTYKAYSDALSKRDFDAAKTYEEELNSIQREMNQQESGIGKVAQYHVMMPYSERDFSTSSEVQMVINALEEDMNRLLDGEKKYGMHGISNADRDNNIAILQEKIDSLTPIFEKLQAVERQALVDSGEYRYANTSDILFNSATKGWNTSKLGVEYNRDMFGLDNDVDKYEELLASDRYKYIPKNKFQEAISGAAELVGQMGEGFFNWETQGLGVAGAGAAFALGQLGPQAALPEEVLTLPGMYMKGVHVGMTKRAFEVESGLAYKEMLENGISENTARKIATGVGAVNAGLEMLQLDELGNAFKILQKNPATQGFAGEMALKLLKDYGINIITETGQEVAQEGTTILGTQIGSKIDKGEWAYSTDEVIDRMVDTGVHSLLSFAVLGGGSAVSGYVFNQTQDYLSDDRVRKAVGEVKSDPEKLTTIIEEGKRFSADTKAAQVAAKVEQDLNDGKEVSDNDVAELLVENSREYVNENIDLFANNEDNLQYLIEEGHDIGGRSSKIADQIATKVNRGEEVTRDDIRRLIEANEAENKKTVEAETQTDEAQKVDRASSFTGYGENGRRAFVDAMETRGDVAPADVALDFEVPYQRGRLGQNENTVKLDTPLKQIAYNAGRLDYMAQMQADRAHQAAAIYSEKDSSVDWTYAPRDITRRQKRFVENFVRSMGARLGFAKGEQRYNAFFNPDTGEIEFDAGFGIPLNLAQKLGSQEYLDKVNRLSKNREHSFIFYVAHEIATHAAMDRAPVEMRAFVSEMYAHKQKDAKVNLAREKQDFYASRNENIDTVLAFEEVVADYILDLYNGNEKAFMAAVTRIMNGTNENARQGARTFKTILDDIIAKLKAWVQKLKGNEKATVEQEISELEHLRGLFETALSSAMETVAEARQNGKITQKNTTTKSGVGKYSIKQTADGRWYVQADRQILFGNDSSKWGKQIEEYINEHIRKGEDVTFPTQDGHILVLTERSAYKLSDRHRGQVEKVNRELLSDEEFALKGTAAGHIDELIQVAKFDGYRPDQNGFHKNDIGEDGFNYFEAYFKDGGPNGEYYLVTFSAGLNEELETTYSIGKIRKRRFPSRLGSSGKAGALIGTKKSSNVIIRTSSEKSQQEKTSFELAHEKAQASKDSAGTVKFALKTPVEVSGELVAMHNITTDKLVAALDRGRLIGPSTAITNKSFNEFGEISLIFRKDSIDPRLYEGNRMYGADAWTPQQTELKKNAVFDKVKTERAIADIKNSIGAEHAKELFPATSRQFQDAIRKADGSIFDAYAHNLGMQTAYAMEQGFISEIPTTADGKVNTRELQSRLDKTLDKDAEWGKYKNWLNSVSDTVISSYDTATNSDILRNMSAQPATAKPFKLSESGELVVPAKEYKSVGEAKRNTHRLSEDATEQTKIVGRQFISFADNIGKKTNTSTKKVVAAINNAFASRYSTDGIVESFANEGITIDQNRAKRLQDLYKRAVELPTPYFEAKLMRPVEFSEIATAVIPSDLPRSIQKRLEDAGVQTVSYKAGDNKARLDAVRSVEGVKFSLKENTGTTAQKNTATKSAIEETADLGYTENRTLHKLTDEGEITHGQGEETVSDSGNVESAGEMEKSSGRETGSGSQRVRRRIAEILRRKAEQGNKKTSDGRRNRRIEFKEPYDSFENRVLKTGCRYVEIISGKVALGFKPAQKEGWTQNVKTAVERLTQWGFNVVVFDDSVHVNRNGVTEVLQDGFTVHEPNQSTIFLSSALRPDGLEAAFHEVFHAMKDENLRQYRNELIDLIADNVDTTCEEFAMFVNKIESLYSYSVQNIPNPAFEQEITEEFFAWYVGKSHVMGNDEMHDLIASFSDVESILPQIDAIYEKMASGETESSGKSSLKGESEFRTAVARIREEGKKAGRTASEIELDVRNFANPHYAELIESYGAIKQGEKPAREVKVPKKTEQGRNVSQTVRTILEAKATPDTVVPKIQEMLASGDFSYETVTDQSAMERAERTIENKGFSVALADWINDVESGKVDKANTALGWELYNQAANAGDVDTAVAILNRMVGHQRNAAQAVQATRILKKLTPDAQLYSAVKETQKLGEELKKKFPKFDGIQINEILAEEFMRAETQEERDRIMADIYRDIGSQMPASWADKFNAWRYMAMLTNLRTHVRNVGGNAGFVPLVIAKDVTAGAIEKIVNFATRESGGIGRTKGRVKRDLLKAAWDDFANVRDIVRGDGKYNETANANRYIEEGRKIYKTKALERVRKLNSELLDREDMWFSKPHYAYALAQYCSANGITAEQLRRGKALGNARAYAIREAQKATYRDTNAFSQAISKLGKTRNANAVEKAIGVAMEGVLPFRKTPANILVRGMEYSPLGLLKGLTVDLVRVQKGEMDAAEAIDNISAGLVGTELVALGAFLAAQGLIRGAGGSDEEKKEFEELQGHQDYALELPDGTSVTLDWLAPEALPFFVGVNLYETIKEGKKGANLADLLSAITNISDPMLELSCLQSLNDVFDSLAYANDNDTSALVAVLSSATTGYLLQYVPTIFGQAERSFQKERMTTYTEKGNWLTSDMQYTLGKTSAKIPGWDFQQIPYIDAWGRMEGTESAVGNAMNNVLNPAYTSKVKTSAMEKELTRLYDETGEAKVLPKRADKYFNVDGERKDLTADEYVKYATEKGAGSYDILSELVSQRGYKEMTGDERVEAVSLAYEYANAVAKMKVASDYEPTGWVASAVAASDVIGMDETDYILYKVALASADPDEKETKRKVDAILSVGGLSDAEMAYLYDGELHEGKAHDAYQAGVDMGDYLEYTRKKADLTWQKGKTGAKKQAVTKLLNDLGLERHEWNYLYHEENGYK